MRILLFGGTTEGRRLCRQLAQLAGADVTVCVATDYGREMLDSLPTALHVHTGRLGEAEMRVTLAGGFDLVVDATHPYAVVVSDNIRAAADAAGVPLLRVLRAESNPAACRYFTTVADAAAALAETEGKALLTTGSKELEAYTVVPNYTRRLYPRVLPTVEAIQKCEGLGFAHSHIIAIQGPFSAELNRATMRQFDIRVLVTKDGGAAGGFAEKVEAALALGAQVLVVGRPPEEAGHSAEEVLAIIQKQVEEELWN